jgi:hypothetical protein
MTILEFLKKVIPFMLVISAQVLVFCPGILLAKNNSPGVTRMRVNLDQSGSLTLSDLLFSPRSAPLQSCDAGTIPWRGVLIGGNHGLGPIHHDNVYVRIDGGPILYHGTIPALKDGNVLPDTGILWHLYTRDDRTYTLYATSSWENGSASILSLPFPLSFCYPTNSCTEQTVPVAVTGDDQVVTPGTEVTLDASNSFDPYVDDTASLFYRWECYSAPETVTLSDNGAAAVVHFTPTTEGRYYFRLNVRDSVSGVSFNRSDIAYTRVSVVNNLDPATLVDANAGGIQTVPIDQMVSLRGDRSKAPVNAVYQWAQTNPVGDIELSALAGGFGPAACAETCGTDSCLETCYLANFDGDNDVDGSDIALLANNWGPITLENIPNPSFVPKLPRPYIFRLWVSSGGVTSTETTIVGAYHPNVAEVLTPGPVDGACMQIPTSQESGAKGKKSPQR